MFSIGKISKINGLEQEREKSTNKTDKKMTIDMITQKFDDIFFIFHLFMSLDSK